MRRFLQNFVDQSRQVIDLVVRRRHDECFSGYASLRARIFIRSIGDRHGSGHREISMEEWVIQRPNSIAGSSCGEQQLPQTRLSRGIALYDAADQIHAASSEIASGLDGDSLRRSVEF